MKYIALALVLAGTATFADSTDPLDGYQTVKTAQTVKLKPQTTAASARAGHLGVALEEHRSGKLVVTDLEPGSPAAAAGLRVGDVLLKIGGATVKSLEAAREWLLAQSPGEPKTLQISRSGKKLSLPVEFNLVSRPMALAERRGLLGVQVEGSEENPGVRVTRVTPGLPAATAGIKSGDVLMKIDGVPLIGNSSLTEHLATREAGETVKVTYLRGEDEKEFEARLPEDPAADREVTSLRPVWRKPVFRLAVVCVEFDDIKHNAKISAADWEKFFFSSGVYRETTNVTGQRVYGSVNDYYRELSCGLFQFEGQVFDWLQVKKKRAEYAQGTANSRTRAEFFGEVFDLLTAREGGNVLRQFDGVAVIYAGERYATANRGTLFWPHRSTTTYHGTRTAYVICPEGGPRMGNISVFCHEVGHILGLPDLYARPENPGSEGVGMWCAMSSAAGAGRPQHFSAWCKERLGWLQPAVIDPTVKQKLILSPVENSTNECFKVLLRSDGSEYLLLENRTKTGFDRSLVGEGLLIWRVVGQRLMLEESHGVEGPIGPLVFLSSIPYPSKANDAFTPYTTPSSRAQLGGGLPVFITNIQRLADGRITFHIGYQYL